MKRIYQLLFSFIVVISAISVNAQVYTMTTGDVKTCSGTFYDSGGLSSNYTDGEYTTMRFISNNGNRISFNFQSFDTESGSDILYVYDGPTTAYPLIGTYSGATLPGVITSTDTVLTFVFSSNNIGNYTGWSASISCTTAPLPTYKMTTGSVTTCSAMFYDNGGAAVNYPNNENRTMTFTSGSTSYLKVSFDVFNVSSGDTLFVYDGSTTTSPLIGYYYGSVLPEDLYSTLGNSLTFKFKSNNFANNIGWRAQISCVTTIPTVGVNMRNGLRRGCGGAFYDSGGALNDYSNNEALTMTYVSNNGNRLSFNFQGFNTELSTDLLSVFDGTSTNAPLLGTFSGTTLPGIINSTDTALTFYFYSNGTTTSTGWNANISCTTPPIPSYNMTSGSYSTCDANFFDSGGLSGNYLFNENKTMTFCSGSTQKLVASFESFNLASGDTLFAYDGTTTSDSLIGYFLGTRVPETFSSKISNCITFKFKSDAANVSTGWKAHLTCAANSIVPQISMEPGVRHTCGGKFYDQGGIDSAYANSLNETMTLVSDNGNRIQVSFSSFYTESGFDKLSIYDGPTSAYPLIGTYSGSTSPGIITSTSTALTFVFISDGNITGSGWNADISCAGPIVPTYNLSSGTTTVCDGIFYDSNGPAANYSANENRTQTFTSATGQKILFTFTHFDVYTDDSLFVYDGTSTAAPLIGIYTGNQLPEIIGSKSGSSVTFKFVSNFVNAGAGWRALISCATTIPSPEINMQTGVRYTCGGKFYDNGGVSGNYTTSFNKSMTLVSDNGNRLQVTFNSFNIESCCDKLTIYDGPSTSSPLIGVYAGTVSPGTILASGTSLTFNFTTDAANVYAGWDADITCDGPIIPIYNLTNTTVTTCSGIFADDGGQSANYLNNVSKVETFCSGSSDKIVFNFTHFNLASDDSLYVYDGASTSAPLIGVYLGTSLPEPIFSRIGSCLTFKFVSNNFNTSAGWRALISCQTTVPNAPDFTMQQGSRYTCGGVFYDSGGNSGNYNNSQSNTMTFFSDNGNRLEFIFQDFSTELCCDYLEVFDGPTSNYPLIGTYKGLTQIGVISSTGTSLTFRFTSDGVNTSTGWKAFINCTTAPLPIYNLTSGTVSVCDAMFYDNGGPAASYPNNENRMETFCSSNGEHLQFTFSQVHYAMAANDSLYVYDGTGTSDPIAVYTQNSILDTIFSSSNCLTFRFKSDATTNATGWRAMVNCTSNYQTPGNYVMNSGIRYTCSGSFTDSGGSSNNYSDGENKTMTFISKGGTGCGIRFTFTDFLINTGDTLYAYNGRPGSLIGMYTGTDLPNTDGIVQSSNDTITFKFISNSSSNSNGWLATISCPNQTAQPTASSNNYVCLSDTIKLYATTIPGASYVWNGPNGFTSTLQNPIIPNSTVAMSGIYSVMAKIAGCSSNSSFTTVSITLPLAVPTLNSNSPVCLGESINLSCATVNAATYEWSGPLTYSSTEQYPTISNSNFGNDGVYTVTVRMHGCSVQNTISVQISPLSVGGSVTGGSDICLGSTTGIMTLNGKLGSVVRWQKRVNVGGWINITDTATTYSEIPTSAGIWNYRALVQNQNCAIAYSAYNSIVVSSSSVGGHLSGTNSICSGTSTGTIQLSNSNGTIQKWQKRVNAGVWSDINITANNYFETPISAGTWDYRVLVQSGTCSSVWSDTLSITVQSQPIGGALSSPSRNICFGQSTGQITLNGSTGTISNWQQRVNGGSWINLNNYLYTFEEIPSSTGLYEYRVVLGTGSCISYSTIDSINVNPVPIGGHLTAPSTTICIGVSTGTISLGNLTGNVLKWQHKFNNDAWSDISINSTNYSETPSTIGTWMYRVQIQSAGCSDVWSDTLTINVVSAPVGGMLTATNTNVCLGNSTGNLTLSGITGTVSKWQKRLSNGSWIDLNSTSITYNEIPSTLGTWEYRAVVGAGSCIDYSSVVTINVNPVPVGGNLSIANTSVCSGSSTGVISLANYVGTITKWQRRINNGSWTNLAIYVPTFSEIPTTVGTWQYRVELQSIGCSNAFSDTLTINVLPVPVGGTLSPANAAICIGSTTGVMTLNGYTGFISKWQKRVDNGTWSDISDTNSTYSETPLTAGTWQYRAEVGNGACFINSSVSTIVVNSTIVGAVTGGSTICLGSPTSSLSLTGQNGAILKWQKRLNTSSWIDISNTSATYTETPSQVGVWDYRAQVKDGVCVADFSTSTTVTVNPLLEIPAKATGDTLVCQGDLTTTYTTNSVVGATSYNWQIAPSGAGSISGTGTSAIVTWTPSFTGSVSVQVSTNSDCGVGVFSPSLTVLVSPIPPKPTISQVVSTLYSSSATGNQWFDNVGIITGETNQWFSPANFGNYHVIVTINDCSSPASDEYFYNQIGVSEQGKDNISVYPNPTNHYLYISNQSLNIRKVEIVNALGQQILLIDESKLTKTIAANVSSLNPGIYFVKIHLDSKVLTYKVVKE